MIHKGKQLIVIELWVGQREEDLGTIDLFAFEYSLKISYDIMRFGNHCTVDIQVWCWFILI